MTIFDHRLSVCLLVALFVAAGAQGAVLPWTSFLDGLQEVPAVPTPATGTGSGTYDTDTNLITWTISFVDLVAPMTNSHFHGPAAPGVSAGVQVPIPFTAGVMADTLIDSATITDAQEEQLLAGLWYINIHSEFRPGGEIRGQVNVVPEPGTYALFGGAIAALAIFRLRKKSA
jgi:hypothetical protein